MCNVDYKVFTQVLTNPLQSVLSDLIGEHQTGGIHERAMNINTHVARSVLDCSSERNQRVAMPQANLAKAFDHVRHDVLFDVLQHVGVGDVILRDVKMACYRISKSCPLCDSDAPTFFVFSLYVELFCLSVWRSHFFNGFKLQSVGVKLLAYADGGAVLERI